MNKCFLLNSEKNLAQILAVVFEKNEKPLTSDALQFRKNDVTVPKATQKPVKVDFSKHLQTKLFEKRVIKLVNGF